MIRKGRSASDSFLPSCFQKVTSGTRFALFKERTSEAFKVTCKIHRHAIGEGRVVLRVSGRLAGDNVGMLRELLDQERSALALDLKDVRLVDGEAVRLLAIHESNGVRIDNCPLYIREWIRRERETT